MKILFVLRALGCSGYLSRWNVKQPCCSPAIQDRDVDAAEETERRWTSDVEDEQSVELREDHQLSPARLPSVTQGVPSVSSFRSLLAKATPPKPLAVEDDPAHHTGDPIVFRASTFDAREKNSRRFRSSLAALHQVRTTQEGADWLEAVRVLKHDAIRLRNTHLSRHSSVLLALADALTFTDPNEQVMDSRTSVPVQRAISLLSEPFINEAAEEEVLIGLLSNGWYLAPDAMCTKAEEICRQPEFLSQEVERARAAATALDGSEREGDRTMGQKANKALADISKNATKGEACHGANGIGGDICIALECGPDETLLTTDESFDHICPAIGVGHERI